MNKTIEDKQVKEFLNMGTELMAEDLSIMVPHFKKALRIAREEERVRAVEKVRTLPEYSFQETNPFANIAQGQQTTEYSSGYNAGKFSALQALTTPLEDKE